MNSGMGVPPMSDASEVKKIWMNKDLLTFECSSHGRDAHATAHTTATLRQFLAPALVFIVACLDRQFQTDFWLHLARGCEIVSTGAWITVDHFTAAARGATVRDANWLSGVIYCRLFTAGGLKLVQTVNAAVLAAAFWLLTRLCRRSGATWRAAGAAAVVTFLLAWQTFLIRPQSFSILLFVLLYGVLSDPNRKGLLLWPPLILCLWANLHGGFVVGLGLIAAFALAEALCLCFPLPVLRERVRVRAGLGQTDPHPGPLLFEPEPQSRRPEYRERGQEGARRLMVLCGTLLLSLLATLINPYGWGVYQYAISLTATVLPRHIEEWLPPSLGQWIGLAFVGSAILLVVLYALARRRPTVREAILLVCFFFPAAHSVRVVVWWAIVLAPILASLLTSLERGDETASRHGSIVAAALCAALLILCIASLPWLERFNPIFRSVRSPHRVESDLDAVARLMPSRPDGGLIFTRMEWAQFLDWRLGPTGRLFIDNHVELFSDRTWRQYCDVSAGADDWSQILTEYSVDYLLLDDTYQAQLLSRVRSSGAWDESYRAGDAILFVRRHSANRAGGA